MEGKEKCSKCKWWEKENLSELIGCETFDLYRTGFRDPPCFKSELFDKAGGSFVRMADGKSGKEDPAPGKAKSTRQKVRNRL